MRYQPIESHGIVGNMHSAALVGLDGSVDWLCLPRFDSPSVFAAILDAEKGGRFRIAPAAAGELRHKQYYWPETNVLVTRFLHPDGIAEIDDFMPVGDGAGPDAQLVRRVRVVRGRLPLEPLLVALLLMGCEIGANVGLMIKGGLQGDLVSQMPRSKLVLKG